MKKLAAFFLALLLLVQGLSAVALATEEHLTDDELTDLLYQMEVEDGQSGEFLVLPEEYKMPVTGLAGVYHLLLIGVDTNNQGLTGRSDTMVLAELNTRQKTVKLISFMRDLYVRIPGRGNNRLNAAHVYGGPELLVRTLEAVFHVPVDGYLVVDFAIMANLVEAIGGINLDVGDEEKDSLNGILEYYHKSNELPGAPELLASSGFVHLNGMQAMAYSRIRKMDSDFERVKRQQKVLAAIFKQMNTMDIQALNNLLMDYLPSIKTNVPMTDVLELLPLAFSMGEVNVDSLTIPVKGGSKNVMKNKTAFLVPNLKKNINAIAEFLNTGS